LRTRQELDLRDRAAVDRFFEAERPEYVFLAAAKVGGIWANATYPADFIRENLQIQVNVIDAAYRYGVKKLLFFGSSCIYPKHAPQPLREEYLLTGPLEPTNEAYAVAKIAGLKMLQAYRRQYGFCGICLMPTNLYGPGDNFDPQTSHVLPALIRRFHEAKVKGMSEVVVWGTGTPRREFLHVDDLADAAVFLMRHYDDEQPINVGVGEDLSIRELAELVDRHYGEGQPDHKALMAELREFFPSLPAISPEELAEMDPEELEERLLAHAEAVYEEKERELGNEGMRLLERLVMLTTIDQLWVHHLTALDEMRQGVGLRGYGGQDPLVVFRREAHDMWQQLLQHIRALVVRRILRETLVPAAAPAPSRPRNLRESGPEKESAPPATASRQPVGAAVGGKVGRNDPCPCGSGRKYKKCCGRTA
jgi:GDP-L-fucose synthase